MAKRKMFGSALNLVQKVQTKRPGVHSKNRHTNQKNGKYYAGSKYRGQGR